MDSLLSILGQQAGQIQNYFEQLRHSLLSEDDSKFNRNTQSLIHAIHHCKNNIYFSGIGKNDAVATKSANMLRSLNFNAHNIDPVHAMHGDMGMIKDGDIIIAISKSGNTAELTHFLKYCKIFKNVTLFGICCKEDSDFSKICNYTIELPDLYEIDNFNKVPTTSIIETQLYIDMIAIYCANLKNLTLEEFVNSHPCGTIGATFLNK